MPWLTYVKMSPWLHVKVVDTEDRVVKYVTSTLQEQLTGMIFDAMKEYLPGIVSSALQGFLPSMQQT